MLGKDSAQALS